MYALNFYSPIVADQLRSRRKTATIRLGDKSAKYRKGMIVQVLAGARYSPRDKIFDAVIDKVEVKTLRVSYSVRYCVDPSESSDFAIVLDTTCPPPRPGQRGPVLTGNLRADRALTFRRTG